METTFAVFMSRKITVLNVLMSSTLYHKEYLRKETQEAQEAQDRSGFCLAPLVLLVFLPSIRVHPYRQLGRRGLVRLRVPARRVHHPRRRRQGRAKRKRLTGPRAVRQQPER